MTHDRRIQIGKLACALSLAAALGCPWAAAADYGTTPLRTEFGAGQVTVEGSLQAQVGRAVAWAVLTDPGRFPEFVPGLQASQVLEEHGREKIVAQRGEITAGPRLRYDGTLRVTERPGQGVHMRFLSGPFKDSEGEWQLSGERPVTLAYRLRIDLAHSPLPPAMAMAVAEQQVRTWLAALVGEMSRRQGAP